MVRDDFPSDRNENGNEIKICSDDAAYWVEEEVDEALVPLKVHPLMFSYDDDKAKDEGTDIRRDQLVHDDEVDEVAPVIAMVPVNKEEDDGEDLEEERIKEEDLTTREDGNHVVVFAPGWFMEEGLKASTEIIPESG